MGPYRVEDVGILVPIDIQLCIQADCATCVAEKPFDSITVHWDCFRTYMESTNGILEGADQLRCLCVPGAWRQPWRRCPSIELRPRREVTERGFKVVTEKLGFVWLTDLPEEVQEIVRGHCEESLVWRYASLMEFVDRAIALGEVPDEPPVLYPLSNIKSWDRGKKPSLVTSTEEVDNPSACVRITIDCRGITGIERLAKAPQPSMRMISDTFAYILAKTADMEDIMVEFKVLLFRLLFLEGFLFSNCRSILARTMSLAPIPTNADDPTLGSSMSLHRNR